MLPVVIMLWWVLLIVVHVSLYVGVWIDASAVARKRGETTFVGPLIWGLTVLPGGVVAVLIYWMIHHSSLAARPAEAQQP